MPPTFTSIQWEFQDPKVEVLYHIRPYFVGIFPYIGLIYGVYLQIRILKFPLINGPHSTAIGSNSKISQAMPAQLCPKYAAWPMGAWTKIPGSVWKTLGKSMGKFMGKMGDMPILKIDFWICWNSFRWFVVEMLVEMKELGEFQGLWLYQLSQEVTPCMVHENPIEITWNNSFNHLPVVFRALPACFSWSPPWLPWLSPGGWYKVGLTKATKSLQNL